MKKRKKVTAKSGVVIETAPQQEFFSAPVHRNDRTVAIEFPKSILSQIGLSEGRANCIILNGILQISGREPKSAIPVMVSQEFSQERA